MRKQQKSGRTWALRRGWYVPVFALALALGLPGLGRVTGREPKVTWVRVQLPDAPKPLDDSNRPAGSVQVVVTALEECWVELETDGTPAFAKLLHAGQSQTVEGSDRVRLITGNAAAISVVLNGKTLEKLGTRGQRRIVDLTREGFELLARR